MILCNHDECTGCLACINTCKHSAITIKEDHLGFYYPEINKKLCTECGLCSSACPILHPISLNEPLSIYSGWSLNEKIRLSSSSGGAFSEIALPILEQGGVVFGCILNKDFKAIHSFIENPADLHQLQRSKYVQSYVGNTFQEVRKFLRQGRKVLFSGTPCQIAGLYSFLKKTYDNLYTVDLICHGVPSPALWEEYKKYISKKENITINSILFRDKSISWIFYRTLIKGYTPKGKEKTIKLSYYKDLWTRTFLSDYYLRESCYQCPYCSTKRIADFTVADWWGYKATTPKDSKYQKKGVSLIFINTEKGKSLKIKDRMYLNPRSIKEAILTNPSLLHAYGKPDKYNIYRDLYPSQNFENIANSILKEVKISFENKILDRVPNNKLISFLLNFKGIKKTIKNLLNK